MIRTPLFAGADGLERILWTCISPLRSQLVAEQWLRLSLPEFDLELIVHIVGPRVRTQV